MEWLKSLGAWVWGALALLAGGAVFAQFALPLFNWFWTFAEANAMTLIALAVVASLPLLVNLGHTHKEGA